MAYATIDDPSVYFQNKTYTGNGSTQSITLDGDTDLQPDLLWIKCRSAIELHTWVDSVRGDSTSNTGYYYFETQSTGAEQAHSGNTLVDAITSDGFNIGNNDQVNKSSGTFVAWAWKESATAGLDIITWAGNETAKTISHNLSAVPHWIIVKVRGTAKQWTCYHKDMTADPNNAGIFLQSTAVPTTGTAGYFNNTVPTSSVFSVGTSTNVNQNSDNVMGYCWTSIQGFSKFGEYTGNGNADGPFIYTGFRPAWFMTKRTDAVGDWRIRDVAREPHQPLDAPFYANTAIAENDGDNDWDVVSNGLKMRGSGTGENASGGTYIYAAFAEAPLVNSNGVPCNAR